MVAESVDVDRIEGKPRTVQELRGAEPSRSTPCSATHSTTINRRHTIASQ